MCPIYDKNIAKGGWHLKQAFEELKINKIGNDDTIFFSDDNKVMMRDWHYRFHYLTVFNNKEKLLDDAIIDFKHYFTVPTSYLMKNRDNRLFRLDDVYAEQITLKFSNYLSRVAIR